MWTDANVTASDYIYITIGYSTATFSLETYWANATDLMLSDGGHARVGQVDEGEKFSYK